MLLRYCAQDADQAPIYGRAVHVPAHSRYLDARLHALVIALLDESHECFFDGLVGERSLIAYVLDIFGHGGESGVGRVRKIVVVEHARVGFGDEFARRRVEGHVVEGVEWGGLFGRLGRGGAVGVGTDFALALVVSLVAGVNGFAVAFYRVMSVYERVFGGQICFVEVIDVADVGAAETGLEDQRSVRADEHSNAAGTAGRAGAAFRVEGYVTRDDDGVAPIPGGGFDPIYGIEQGVRAAVAGVDCVDAFNIGVT